MGKIRSYLYGAACACMATCVSAPAFAVMADNSENFPRWYVGLRGSINTLRGSDLGTYPLPQTDYDPGFGGGASVGVMLPRAFIEPLANLRFEGEVSFYSQHIDNNRTDFVFPLMVQSNGERAFKVTSYMVNAFYHFPVRTALRPYIGGGIGTADVELERDPVAPIRGDNEDTVAAWQAMAGFSFEETPYSLTEWHLGYRYFTSDDPEFDDGFGGITIIENHIHSVEAGVKFRM